MGDEKKQITPQELVALCIGLSVTIGSSLLTTLVTPMAFPLNLLLSLTLGSAAGYGTLKVLDPRTMHDLLEAQASSQYRQMLQEIEVIATSTGEASQSLGQISPDVSGRLGNITRMTRMVLNRYKERQRDYSGASATLLILQRFDEILGHYLKVKRGELFIDEDQREKEIAQTERRIIPTFELALENLGKKLDAGETLNKGISKGTLESMLQSLNLIESLGVQIGSSSETGDFDDQNT